MLFMIIVVSLLIVYVIYSFFIEERKGVQIAYVVIVAVLGYCLFILMQFFTFLRW